MASVVTHVAWTALVGRAIGGERLPRKVTALALLFAVAPDLDFAVAPFSEAPNDLWAHRGLSHSPLFLLVAAVAIGALLNKKDRARNILLLFSAGVGHSLLDLFTWGGPGVALLAPFTSHRFLAPAAMRLVPVVPLGADEYFGRLGLLAFSSELLYVLLPTLLLVYAIGLREERATRRELVIPVAIASAWLLLMVGFRASGKNGFAPPRERVIVGFSDDPDEGPAAIPGPLVTRYEDLQRLFNVELRPKQVPWASEFFPFWFGGHAGRWKDSVPTLLARTVVGTEPPSSMSLADDLSPTEKYDLARADAAFSVTAATLKLTHNRRPRPRFWFGLCNGAAGASLSVDEPYRTVDVVNRAGTKVRFHPNDVKALLAAAYFRPAQVSELGDLCREVEFDSGARCSVHPAAFALAVLNRLGIAGESFLVEVHPTKQSQYYPVAAATVRVVRPLYSATGGAFASLVDVVIDLELSSTLLPSRAADVPDPKWTDGTGYQRVGVRPIHMSYPMTLAMNERGEIVGGRYTGDPAEGPDQLQFVSRDPAVLPNGHLEAYPELRWSAVQALAKASISAEKSAPTIDATLFDDP